MADEQVRQRHIRTEPEPWCPRCGAVMKLRRPKPGQNWSPFWSCNRWPTCHGVRQIGPDGLPEDDDPTWDDSWS